MSVYEGAMRRDAVRRARDEIHRQGRSCSRYARLRVLTSHTGPRLQPYSYSYLRDTENLGPQFHSISGLVVSTFISTFL